MHYFFCYANFGVVACLQCAAAVAALSLVSAVWRVPAAALAAPSAGLR